MGKIVSASVIKRRHIFSYVPWMYNAPKAHVVRAWVSAYDTVLCGLSALQNFDLMGLNLSYLYEIIITLVSIKLFEAYL